MNWSEVLNQCLNIILPAIASVVAVIFGIVGNKIKQVYDKKAEDATVKSVIDTTVRFVQQVYNNLNGPEKLQQATLKASALLNEKGISISETELNMLIEAAVYGLNEGINEYKQIQTLQAEQFESVTEDEALPEGEVKEETENVG